MTSRSRPSAKPGPVTSVATSRTARRCTRTPTGAPVAGLRRCSPTSTPGSPSTKTSSAPHSSRNPICPSPSSPDPAASSAPSPPATSPSRASTSSGSTTTCGPTSSAPRPRRPRRRRAWPTSSTPSAACRSTSATARASTRLFAEHGSKIELVVHTAAQPSHDWAAREPHTDFTVNANGTLNLLQAARENCPDATFVFTSTNKVYGDRPNELPLRRARHALGAARGPQVVRRHRPGDVDRPAARTRCSAPPRSRPTSSCRSTGATSTCRPSASAAAASPAPSTPAPSCTASCPT